MIIMGMMVVVGGINTMLGQQMESSLTVQKLSFGKVQALYLAEMGVNQLMYEANSATGLAGIATTGYDPFATLLSTNSGSEVSWDFKSNIPMIRNVAGGTAVCTATRGTGMSFSVLGTLFNPGVGTFKRAVTFTAGKSNAKYRLLTYAVTL